MSELERWSLVFLLLGSIAFLVAAFWRGYYCKRQREGFFHGGSFFRLPELEDEAACRRWPVEKSDFFLAAIPLAWFGFAFFHQVFDFSDQSPVVSDSGFAFGVVMDAVMKGILFVPIVLRLAMLSERGWLQWLGVFPEPKAFGKGLLVGGLAIVAAWAGNFVLHGLLHLLQWELPKQAQIEMFLEQGRGGLFFISFVLAAVVIAPVLEEFLFRGFLYPVLRQRIGMHAAVIGNSLLFALVHANLAGFLGLFVLSCGLTLSYEFSKSIWTPILIHGLFNLISVVALFVTL